MTLLASAEPFPVGLATAVTGVIVYAVFGCLLGWGVAAGVGRLIRLIESDMVGLAGAARGREPSGFTRAAFAAACGIVGGLVFAWEVLFRGLDPVAVVPGPGDTGPWNPAWVRAAAHLVLFAFMAAAVWCDFEYRLIPDAITVPGAVLGLVCVTACPELLLPVGWEQARSYAPPLVTADVLGALGPLEATADSPWLAPAPSPWSLGVLAVSFAAWWMVCTAAAAARSAWRDPRTWILPVGLAAIAVAWLAGGRGGAMLVHFRAAQSAVLGAAVSGGIVWLIREGGSRALGREAMGLGDVTLMAMVGSWCGWQHGVLTFFAAAFVGLAQGLATWLMHRDNELPYGPSLCLAAAVVILAWRGVWQAVGIHFEEPMVLAAAVIGVILLTALSLAGWARLRGG